MIKQWYLVLTMFFSVHVSYSMQQASVETMCKMVMHLRLKGLRLSDYEKMDIQQLQNCFDMLDLSGKKIGADVNGKNTDFKTYVLLRLRTGQFAVDNIEPEMPAGAMGKLLIPKCITIQTIDLSKNELAEVPKELFEFRHLKKLLIANNKITHLPGELVLMKSLEEADFSHNQIVTIIDKAEWIGKDPLLVRFNIAHNKLNETEKEMVRAEWSKNREKKKDNLTLDVIEENKIITIIEKQCGDQL